MKNNEAKDGEEELVVAVTAIDELLRKLEPVDPRAATKLREHVQALLDKERQRIWDGMPDKLKREALDQQDPEPKSKPKKRKDEPSQAFEAPTDFMP